MLFTYANSPATEARPEAPVSLGLLKGRFGALGYFSGNPNRGQGPLLRFQEARA